MSEEESSGRDVSLTGVLREFMAPASTPLGLVYPPRTDAPGLPDKGAREIALRRLADFIAALPFMRTMAGPPQPFLVPREQIHINQPDSVVGAGGSLNLPYVALLTSTSDDMGEVRPGWLGPAQDIAGTENVYAPNSALFYIGDHIENVVLEVVAAKPATRRAIVEGLKQVFRSSDDTLSLRLSLPDYFDQDATFTLLSSQYIEDENAVRNRRRAQLTVELYVAEVMLANAMDLQPFVSVTTQLQVLDSGT